MFSLTVIGLPYPALQALLCSAARLTCSHASVYSGRLAGLCLTTRPPGQGLHPAGAGQPVGARSNPYGVGVGYRLAQMLLGYPNVRCAAGCPDGPLSVDSGGQW